MPGQGAYAYGDATRPHRLTAVGATNYTYDGNGNTTARGSATYTFNAENMLASTTGPAETYVYDADGGRVRRTFGSSNFYFVNRWYYKDGSGSVRVQYQLGGRIIATKNGSTLRYVHEDHLGSLASTTTTAGAADGAERYYPYGLTRTAGGGFGSNRRFTEQFKDTETALYFYNARYYDPAIGRFTSPDSLVPDPYDPRSYNRYSYVTNNPLKYTDPSGHCWGPARNLAGCGKVRDIVDQTRLVGQAGLVATRNVVEVVAAAVVDPLDSVQLAANIVSQPNPTNITNDALGLVLTAMGGIGGGGDIDITPDAIVVTNVEGAPLAFMEVTCSPTTGPMVV